MKYSVVGHISILYYFRRVTRGVKHFSGEKIFSEVHIDICLLDKWFQIFTEKLSKIIVNDDSKNYKNWYKLNRGTPKHFFFLNFWRIMLFLLFSLNLENEFNIYFVSLFVSTILDHASLYTVPWGQLSCWRLSDVHWCMSLQCSCRTDVGGLGALHSLRPHLRQYILSSSDFPDTSINLVNYTPGKVGQLVLRGRFFVEFQPVGRGLFPPKLDASVYWILWSCLFCLQKAFPGLQLSLCWLNSVFQFFFCVCGDAPSDGWRCNSNDGYSLRTGVNFKQSVVVLAV